MKLINRIIGFITLSLVALLVTGCGAPASQVLVTQSGPVQGVTNEGVAIFRGIPYAAPPLGELRWAAPQPVQPWTEPLIADAYGPNLRGLN